MNYHEIKMFQNEVSIKKCHCEEELGDYKRNQK
jgi:hypothetical protein